MSCGSLLALDSGIPFYAHYGQSFALFWYYFLLYSPVSTHFQCCTDWHSERVFSSSYLFQKVHGEDGKKKLSKDSPVLEVYLFCLSHLI